MVQNLGVYERERERDRMVGILMKSMVKLVTGVVGPSLLYMNRYTIY